MPMQQQNEATSIMLDCCYRAGNGFYSVDGVEKMQEFFVARLKQALAHGADVLAMDDKNRDALELLAMVGQSTSQAAVRCAKALVDAGYPVIEKHALHVTEGPLRKQLALHLNRLERAQTVPLKDARGNTVLHDLCRNESVLLDVFEKLGNEPIYFIDCAQASMTNKARETPLHVLWRASPRRKRNSETMWAATDLLLNAGANPMAAGIKNETAMTLIGRAMEKEGLQPLNDAQAQVLARCHRLAMDAAAPAPASTAMRSRRL